MAYGDKVICGTDMDGADCCGVQTLPMRYPPLRACYTMSGTDIAYGAIKAKHNRTLPQDHVSVILSFVLSAYRGTCHAIPSTDAAYGATRFPERSNAVQTPLFLITLFSEVAAYVRRTRCPVLIRRILLSAYAPGSTLMCSTDILYGAAYASATRCPAMHWRSYTPSAEIPAFACMSM
eukprot:3224844-Rhodomonas_salina.10